MRERLAEISVAELVEREQAREQAIAPSYSI
jgi:hypothetical protein